MMQSETQNSGGEDFSNLVDFFELLIKVDRRNNADLYKEKKPLEKGRIDYPNE
jgi:hypothetical protein